MKKITINNTQYLLKYTIRALFVFENIAGHSYMPGKLIDDYLLFYSMLLANNESFSMPFDEFIAQCDNDYSLFDEFKALLLEVVEMQTQNAPESDKVKKKTKIAKK